MKRAPTYGPREEPTPGRVARDGHSIEVEVVEVPWIDTLTNPAEPRPHGVGRRLLLPVRVYRRVRGLAIENVARRFVRCERFGRSYLHAVSACRARLLGLGRQEAPHEGRLRVRGSEYAPPGGGPVPERPAVPVVVPGPVAVRGGCGCLRSV